MKKAFIITLMLGTAMSALLCGCSTNDASVPSSSETSFDSSIDSTTDISSPTMEKEHTLTIGNHHYTVQFEDSREAEAVKKLLPITAEFTELNGNEKYYQMEKSLPSADMPIAQIHKGDLMLYNASYLVLFYQDFETNYSYTRVGHLENPEDLDLAVGNGNVTITIQ